MTLGLILFGASRHLDPLWANRVCGVHGLSLHTFGVSAAVGHQHPVGLGSLGTPRIPAGSSRASLHDKGLTPR